MSLLKFPWRRFSTRILTGAPYQVVRKPGNVSLQETVPETIMQPSYSITGVPSEPEEMQDYADDILNPSITCIRSEEEIQVMRNSGELARSVLKKLKTLINVGVSTEELDKFAYNYIVNELKSYPSPLNYKGYPKSICTSINNVACHGIPDDTVLCDGDIVSIDVTVYNNGFHGDCCDTYLIGDVNDKGKNLVNTAYNCLHEAINVCKDGEDLCEIGAVIAATARKHRVSVIPTICGHGIGNYFHGPPDIYHIKNGFPGIMQEGMIFTIEPVICEGNTDVIILEDGWTVVTLDNSRTSQFEHTILITSNGAEILTKE